MLGVDILFRGLAFGVWGLGFRAWPKEAFRDIGFSKGGLIVYFEGFSG
jgi:hypothetical protein